MVARFERGEQNRQHSRRQNRLDERPSDKPATGSRPRVVLRKPASWGEVEEYFRWRAVKDAADTSEA